jgi:hypothetical protein
MEPQDEVYADDHDWRTTAEALREDLREILDLATTELDNDQLRPALLTIAGFARSGLGGDAR